MRLVKFIVYSLLSFLLLISICFANESISLPNNAVVYTPTNITQSISILDERDTILPVPIKKLDDKRWHQPGGLDRVDHTLYSSCVYRTVLNESRIRTWIGNIGVKNSFGYIQQNRGIIREYPIGTRFDEVLTNTQTNRVFEQRTREKSRDGWLSVVNYSDPESRPNGYTGLTVSCSSCHNSAGTGGYATGLVPGGDTVLSDPLDWSLLSYTFTPVTPTNGSWTDQPIPTPKTMTAPLPSTFTPIQYVEVRSGLFGRRVSFVPATATSCASSTSTIPSTITTTTMQVIPTYRLRRVRGCN